MLLDDLSLSRLSPIVSVINRNLTDDIPFNYDLMENIQTQLMSWNFQKCCLHVFTSFLPQNISCLPKSSECDFMCFVISSLYGVLVAVWLFMKRNWLIGPIGIKNWDLQVHIQSILLSVLGGVIQDLKLIITTVILLFTE